METEITLTADKVDSASWVDYDNRIFTGTPILNQYQFYVFGRDKGCMHGYGTAKIARDTYGVRPGGANNYKAISIFSRQFHMEPLDNGVFLFEIDRFISHAKKYRLKCMFFVSDFTEGLYKPEVVRGKIQTMMRMRNIILDKKLLAYLEEPM